MRGNLRGEAVHNVPGQHDGLLHFKELLGFDGGQRVFLRLYRAVLKGKINLGKGDGGWVGTTGFGRGSIGRHIRHANLDALHAFAIGKGFLRGGVPRAVVGVGRDLNA